MSSRARVAMFMAIVGAGCSDPGSSNGDAGVDAPDPYKVVAEVPVTVNRALDLLFVIDDSTSMSDKQANLANNFPNFINVLNTLPGGLPDVHIGVVTTDMGTKASGDASPGPAIGSIGTGGCSGVGKAGRLQTSGAPVTGTFVSDIKQTDGTRVKNYTGNLADVFGQMARVGSGGCGFEQPLAAMRAALDNNPANAGFLRPDAILGVMFLTDEDDCSMTHTSLLGPESAALGPLMSFRCTRFGVTCATGGATSDAMNQIGDKGGCSAATSSPYLDPIGPFRQFLVGLKSEQRKVVVGAIMGAPEPVAVELRSQPGGGTPVPALAHSCSYQSATGIEVSDPAVRLKAFLDEFPTHSTWSTICQQDLSDALVLMAQQLTFAIGTPCVSALLADADPGTAGLQPDCIVEDIAGAAKLVLPACDATMSNRPCWHLTPDLVNCPVADHQKLVIERTEAPIATTITRMRCLVE